MSEYKITISINDHTLTVLDEAGKLWPELAGNRSALFRKLADDWSKLRSTIGGGRTSYLSGRLDEHEVILRLICAHLEIEWPEGVRIHGNNRIDATFPPGS